MRKVNTLITPKNSILLCIDIQGKLAEKACTSEMLHKKSKILIEGHKVMEDVIRKMIKYACYVYFSKIKREPED